MSRVVVFKIILTVVRDLMTSFVNSQKVQVVDGLELAVRCTVNRIVRELCRLELAGVRVIEVVYHELTSVLLIVSLCSGSRCVAWWGGGQRDRLELGGGSKFTYPVANPVEISCPDQHVYSALDHLAEWFKEASSLISTGDNLCVGGRRAFAVGRLGSNSGHYCSILHQDSADAHLERKWAIPQT